MSWAFSKISNILQSLEDIELHDPPLLGTDKSHRLQDRIKSWFASHRRAINELNVRDATALLSTFFPERRTDRVYGLQAPTLCRILGRSLSLGATRRRDLEFYKRPGHGDLGACIERVLRAGGSTASPAITLADVDDMLDRLASQCRFSDRSITDRPPSGSSEARDQVLARVLLRASSVEGKWLVRLVLKDFAPVRVDESLILEHFHFLLPDLLHFQDNFECAVSLLKGTFRYLHPDPDMRSQIQFRLQASEKLSPVVGVKVGRPDFQKARGIKHCMDMLGEQKWVLERKYDGEYCEIHVDLSASREPSKCIQIFSKSGKNSTTDRKGIHQTLVDCLRLGQSECKIKKHAILLGELVVFSDKDDCILPFHKIRSHVSRSGVYIGTEKDSQPQPWEHLAIVFFDLLLLDDEVVMKRPVEERRNWLREVYVKMHGRAMGAEWKLVNFAHGKTAETALIKQFAASNAQRCEGLVLKSCGVPYFSLLPGIQGRNFIKLKRDYIQHMGDEADFAVLGASYDAQLALKTGITGLKWTTFHLGCIINKADVQRFFARPVFKVVDTIESQFCIPKPVLAAIKTTGTRLATPHSTGEAPSAFDLVAEPKAIRMDVTFYPPPVLEVLGSGFVKASGADFFMLRHARVVKLHEDRSWLDCVSFQELQDQARAAVQAPVDSESQETRRMIENLEGKARRKFERQQSCTPRTTTKITQSTTSVRRPIAANAATQPSPLSDRCINALPTPVRTSQSQGLPSSAVDQRTIVGLAGLARKRTCDENDGTTIKHQRITHAAVAIPRELGLIECSTSSHPAVQQACTLAKRPPRWKQPVNETRNPTTRCAIVHSPSASSSELCSSSRCLFSMATLYLSTCVSTAPYITETLFATHNCSMVSRLSHWDRDSLAYPSSSETVAESQACLGLRKLILVESRRRKSVQDLVDQIVHLNDGRFRERVDVYDWRVLDDCVEHDKSAEALKKHFIGATVFDQAADKAMFVSRLSWLSDGAWAEK